MSTSSFHLDARGGTVVSFLYDRHGRRKYLTRKERDEFLGVALSYGGEIWAFCLVLAYTGARLSEVCALTYNQIDFETETVVIRNLKKRNKSVTFRAIPVPQWVLADLDAANRIRRAQGRERIKDTRIWDWGRTTAWKRVKKIMAEAGIEGPQAMPKGVRHGFGANALLAGVPLNIVQIWMGHANMKTTALYGNLVGDEERQVAALHWNSFGGSTENQ